MCLYAPVMVSMFVSLCCVIFVHRSTRGRPQSEARRVYVCVWLCVWLCVCMWLCVCVCVCMWLYLCMWLCARERTLLALVVTFSGCRAPRCCCRFRRLRWYPVVLLFSWCPVGSTRLWQAVATSPPPLWLDSVAAFCVGANGYLNSVAYGVELRAVRRWMAQLERYTSLLSLEAGSKVMRQRATSMSVTGVNSTLLSTGAISTNSAQSPDTGSSQRLPTAASSSKLAMSALQVVGLSLLLVVLGGVPLALASVYKLLADAASCAGSCCWRHSESQRSKARARNCSGNLQALAFSASLCLSFSLVVLRVGGVVGGRRTDLATMWCFGPVIIHFLFLVLVFAFWGAQLRAASLVAIPNRGDAALGQVRELIDAMFAGQPMSRETPRAGRADSLRHRDASADDVAAPSLSQSRFPRPVPTV